MLSEIVIFIWKIREIIHFNFNIREEFNKKSKKSDIVTFGVPTYPIFSWRLDPPPTLWIGDIKEKIFLTLLHLKIVKPKTKSKISSLKIGGFGLWLTLTLPLVTMSLFLLFLKASFISQLRLSMWCDNCQKQIRFSLKVEKIFHFSISIPEKTKIWQFLWENNGHIITLFYKSLKW